MSQDMLGDPHDVQTAAMDAGSYAWPCRRARRWSVLTHKTKVARAKAKLPECCHASRRSLSADWN
eukprot:9151816-Alexandrium_andersonii.AAC.1